MHTSNVICIIYIYSYVVSISICFALFYVSALNEMTKTGKLQLDSLYTLIGQFN